MVSYKSKLIMAEPLETPTKVVLGDGQSLEATHQGEAIIPPNIQLTKVFFVLGLKENRFFGGYAIGNKQSKNCNGKWLMLSYEG